MKTVDISHIEQFLHCPTPDAWIESALQYQDILLIDHANCEKKAASTAMSLMYRYIDKFDLLNKLSKLAREELRHFEQVIEIMVQRDIEYIPVSASRYAGGLMKHVSTYEPARLIDTLIVGAIVEARSCERFAKLAPYLDDELKAFYLSLLKSESRHFLDYLSLARQYSDGSIDERVNHFLALEVPLIESEDDEFRFHSGILSV